MSLVTSHPPDSSTENAPATRAQTPTSRFALRNSRWRPALACAGAMGIGLSLAPMFLRPPASADSGRASDDVPAEIVLASESTFLVTPTLPPGALLRGQIRLVADITGKARVTGEVARHLVESGARVRRGDAIVEISSGAERRTVLPSERRQNRAERGQIAAADAQTALAQKIGAAQGRLRDAQERVARSQTQVSNARDIVRRLQNGSAVSPGELPAPFRGQAPQIEPFRITPTRKRRVRRVSRSGRVASDTSRIALRQAEAARDAAKSSARDLQVAQKTLADAQKGARDADEKLQSAIKAVADVEARFGAKKASGADVEAARSAQAEAQQAVNTADKALLASKAEVTKRETSAKSSQDYAESAAAQAAKSLSAARLDLPSDDDVDAGKSTEPENFETPPQNSASAAPSRVTLDQAIRFAGVALAESRRASRDAERIHAQIEGYQTQVTSSQSRVEAASQDLVSAQQKVLDSTPRPRFTTTYAPADGVVMWMSRLARQVDFGQAVFGVARGEKVAAHFEDKSGLWRAIKKDATLPAFVVDSNTPSAPKTPDSIPKTGGNPVSPESTSSNSPPATGYPVQVKITEIDTPAQPGAPATLTAEVRAAPGAGGASPFKAGAGVLIPLPRPHQKATLSVPASAVVQRGNGSFVAVLSPVEAQPAEVKTPGLKTTSSPRNHALADTAPRDEAGPVATEEQSYRLDWRRVETGRGDGLRVEITAGLQAGTRVIALPEQLEAMGFEPVVAAQPVTDAKTDLKPNNPLNPASTPPDIEGATPGRAGVSETAMPTRILVHLTPALT